MKKQKALCLSSSSLHNTSDHGRLEGADSYSVGTILCCDPTSDSDVRHCNFRFWENLDSNIGDKVWNGISNLGVVAMDKKKDYSKKISDIEAKDKEWNGMKVEGNSDYVIKEKLKILKVSLRRWNKEVFGWYDLKVEEGVEEINTVDKLLSSCMDNEVKELVDRRSKAISSIWRNLSIKDNMLIQKSRVKWIQEGNLNSRYFHNLVKGKARRKFIGDVNTVNRVVEMIEDVKKVVRNFFNLKFMEPDPIRPVLEGLPIRTLSQVLFFTISERDTIPPSGQLNGAVLHCWRIML
ncbi:hypothetical protein KIW84_063282 [Lathyrus oleraceus]|uniref:RNA-directed DNA polymerase, eukaryota, reverse transcriptase zinc-binding domain protein n=1 Tax=Pisum sativum TaxID=3888 RepID=A0A9D4W937_PEA|nr:hypothetical protein KIW84_063282 [Pisum sativum]